jgi:non-specific serine/threonine protein kinase
LRIANALLRFWEIRGYLPEGMNWLDRLLAQVDEKVPLVVRANAFTFASHIAMFLGNSAAATTYANQAVALAETAGEEGNPMLIMALGGLSSSAQAAGDYQTAFEIGERTLLLLRSTPVDPFLSGMSYLGIGNIAVEAGYYDTARELLSESLRMAQETGDAFRLAHTFTTLGNLARYEGDYAEAAAAYEKSVALLRELDARLDLAAMLRNLGRAFLLLDDVERAQALFFESLSAHQAEQNTLGIAECLIGLGSTAVLHGMPAPGARLIAAAQAIREQRLGFTWPVKPMGVEPYLELARTRLTEAEFLAEQVTGRAMSLHQAIQYAQNLPFKRDIPIARKEKMDELTEREREVAALIAQGKSNREIATLLVLSPRTIEKHVENILSTWFEPNPNRSLGDGTVNSARRNRAAVSIKINRLLFSAPQSKFE